MCYHAEFGRSTSKSVGINTGEAPKWGALGPRPLEVGAWLTLEIRYSTTCVILKHFGRSSSNDTSVIKKIRPKI